MQAAESGIHPSYGMGESSSWALRRARDACVLIELMGLKALAMPALIELPQLKRHSFGRVKAGRRIATQIRLDLFYETIAQLVVLHDVFLKLVFIFALAKPK